METSGMKKPEETEAIQARLWVTLLEKLSEIHFAKPVEQSKVNLSNYSKAYQNFAQNNVSKSEKIETIVEVKQNEYTTKLNNLLASKKSN